MKIHSKFHDYYDTAAGWIDKELHYPRVQEEIKYSAQGLKELSNNLFKVLDEMPHSPHRIKRYVLSFCGKLYPIVEFDSQYFFNLNKLEEYLHDYIKRHDVKKHYDPYGRNACKTLIKDLNDKSDRWFIFPRLSHRNWRAYKHDNTFEIDDSVHVNLKAPTFLLDTDLDTKKRFYRILTNPCLKDLGFASIVDPYTAFQEISMFIGNNMAVQMDPNIDRTDDLIRDSKGFDKWSFRKVGKNSKR